MQKLDSRSTYCLWVPSCGSTPRPLHQVLEPKHSDTNEGHVGHLVNLPMVILWLPWFHGLLDFPDAPSIKLTNGAWLDL